LHDPIFSPNVSDSEYRSIDSIDSLGVEDGDDASVESDDATIKEADLPVDGIDACVESGLFVIICSYIPFWSR
jgi:hypothetical protein